MTIGLRVLGALCLAACVCAVSIERKHGFLDVDWNSFRSVGTPASPRVGPSAATDLKVEYLTNPRGIDSQAPRFSWVPVHAQRAQNQSAYHVQVMAADGTSMWDSGKVQSSQISQVAYAGSPLSSDADYSWTVRWWDDAGSASPWSAAATFTTGLFNVSDWQGSWITAGGVGNQLRKQVDVPFAVSRASVFVSGLGYYELYINGQRVGDHRLDPGWTTYQKRVLYSSYDATSLFVSGVNCIAAVLGRGWYGQESYGNSTLLLQINVEGFSGKTQTIVTDGSWEASAGPIVYDDIYNGEHYDARLETPYSDFCSSSAAWSPAVTTNGPGGVLAAQTFQPIKKITEIAAVKVTNPQPGYYVVDFGQSLSGYCRLTVNGPTTAGTTITLAHAEILKPDGSGMIYTAELRSAQATDMYTTKGSQSGETYEPRFTYHGFRYVQITGMPYAPDLGTVTAVHIRSSVDTIGQISFSVPILNQIQHNIFWGQSTNLMSVPTDCDNRDERKGWMGDAALSADEAFHNFDMPALYTNWMNMIQDEQSLDQDGALTDTTPLTFGSRQSDPSWGTAYPTILHGMWKYHGDTTIIRNHFQSLKAYINWLVSLAEKDFANFYVEYGDWVPPPPFPRVDGSLTSAFSFLHDLIYYADMAAAIGESSEQQRALDLFSTYAPQFNTAFFNQTSGVYLDGLQTGQCLPLWLDIIPSDTKASVLKYIVDDIVKTNNVHLTTGIIGTKFLSLSLSDNAQSNVALALATQTSYPSWGYMITNTIEPATTLWELWNTPTGDPGMDSRDHIMFGSVGHWFYTVLAGIDQTPDSVAFETVQFMPRATVSSLVRSFARHSAGANASYTEVNRAAIVHGAPLLDWVSASVNTARGPVAISWAADGDKLSFAVNVTVPITSSALVYVPIAPGVDPSTVMVSESGSVVWKGEQFVPGVDGVTAGQFVASVASGDGPFIQLTTGAGSYQFMLTVASLDEALPALQ